ncbi:COR domain-containing protein [Desulfonema magnum]|uniref:non-specific serine/threonine protein kinase n=1 Tax=Desulfonema magnum TaxID=45655 RepID=A0A975BIC5_9BACT|nr:COR domain-containing protein [Desulfonema magnum]QTA85600.1 Leucine-rich repeat containing-protein [Desulfonema magnum]
MTQEELVEIIRKAEKEQSVVLDLSHRNITQLPREIGRLRNLFVLYLGSNQLRELPREIVHLKNLTQLDLNSNQLTEFPKHIVQLKNLFRLDLSFNQVAELPREIVQLKNLTILDLTSNQMNRLPTEIIHLKKLKILELDQNPLTFPPMEIVARGLPAVTNYLKKSDKGGQILYEAKLMIVGQGGVGKTCLMERLIQNRYSEKQATTQGIRIQSWEINAPDEEKTRMTLNVWDFGGQEIYHATHQFFLTRHSLYVLVWDARQEDEHDRIDYWLNIIDTFAEDSPILIVMNKSDERTRELNLSGLKQRYPQIIASGKVSAKNGTGIEILQKLIETQAWELPLMGTFWPSSWLAVRSTLKATPDYHIPYDNYLQICKKLDIEESEAKTLSRYLHDLGIVLHFQDDALLKDTIILKPGWGTDAVYKVLDANVVQKRNGILHNSDLPKIWTDKALYPPDKYAAILRLMANFELAFPFDKGNRHIVTELLPPRKGEYEWNPEGCLQFEYHYEFLPAGLITRLIVRMHKSLIERGGKKLCWREGAYFKHGESQAMVRINAYTKIARIQISGNERREFLSMIRSHFDALHKTIRKIRFKEKIPCGCNPGCDYRFDYNFLLKCEEKGKITQTCEVFVEEVNVKKLLDTIEKSEVREQRIREKTENKYSIELDPSVHVKSLMTENKSEFGEPQHKKLYQKFQKIITSVINPKKKS